jgi:SAM-dependent methyltransferase
MASTPTGVAAVFDRAAETYDAVGVPWFQPIAAGLVAELAVRPGERVLDIGCGRGAALIPLAAAAGPTGSVLGIDLAPRMVELTARDVRHLPQVTVQVADAASPQLPAASFDVIAASLVLFFLPEPVPALRQWWALLVPGGRLGITTFDVQDPRWLEIDAVFLPYLPAGMLDARASGRRGPYSSDDGVSGLLTEAGFVDVRTSHHDVEAVFDSPAHLLQFTWSHGQRAMWEAVPEAERDVVAQQVLDTAARLAEPSGRLRLRQRVRCTLGLRGFMQETPGH